MRPRRIRAELAGLGAHVTGCDFSLAALSVGAKRLHALNHSGASAFVQGDAQALPFADQSFDIVVSCETIEHLPEVQTALREMWRVTRPGGKFFLTTPNYANLMDSMNYMRESAIRGGKTISHSIAGSGFCKFAGG